MAQRSVMKHDFSRVPEVSKPRSTFDRSMRHLTTFDAGYLVPVYNDQIYPGDTVNFDFRAFCRLATPLHPFMDNMYLDWMAFFIPHRLVWDNFQKFMGEQVDPGDSIDFLAPVSDFPVGGYAVGSLQDFFGLPTEIAGGNHIVLPIRAYNLLYNQHIRDQNLQDSVVVDKDDGPDTVTDYTLLRRGKRHDYFTSCLPWPQKGEEVSIPLGTTAPVKGFAVLNDNVYTTTPAATWRESGTVGVPGGTDWVAMSPDRNISFRGDNTTKVPNIYADLTTAADVTINALRTSIAVQQFLEIDARSGTRYIESNLAHFGVTSPDARLQRAEYLMGGSYPINVSPVAQNSSSVVDSPQGNLAAIGTVSIRKDGFTKSFTEHGTLLVLVSARADLSYQQGLDRKWSLRTREEWYYPSFAHLGEQAVLNKEIYFQGTAGGAADDSVFGYQERYAELRYNRSYVTGQFRSTFATSLDTWHLAQDFTALPTLGSAFIVDDPPVDRVIAVTSEPHFLGDFWFGIKHSRVMPMFGVPGLLRL